MRYIVAFLIILLAACIATALNSYNIIVSPYNYLIDVIGGCLAFVYLRHE